MVIERAVGYLMGAYRLDAVTAFDILRKRARDSRRRIAEIASEVLGGDTGPDGIDLVSSQHTANGQPVEPRGPRTGPGPIVPPGTD